MRAFRRLFVPLLTTLLFGCSGEDEAASGATSAGGGGAAAGGGSASSTSAEAVTTTTGSGGAGTGGAGEAGAATGSGGAGPVCATSGPPRPMIAAINGDTDSVAVLRFEDAQIVDDGIRITSLVNPRGLAIRSDGGEAIVGWGGAGDAYGVAVIALDGADPPNVDIVDLGTGQTPWAAAYATSDHAVLATAGPSMGTLVALDRVGGKLEAGTTMTIPGNWPLDVAGRPGHDEVILGRANLATDDALEIFRVGRSGADWSIVGTAGEVDGPPIDFAVHSSGDVVYSPTSDPADPVTSGNLDAKGLLHVLAVTDAGVAPQTTLALPGLSSYGAIAPNGQFLVLPTSIYEIDDSTSSPIVKSYAFYTVTLDAEGTPTATHGPSETIPGLLFDDVEVALSGHLLTALQLYQLEAPPGEDQPLIVWGQSAPGVWEKCQTIFLGGAVDLAVAR
jgi:hypothetical protein